MLIGTKNEKSHKKTSDLRTIHNGDTKQFSIVDIFEP